MILTAALVAQLMKCGSVTIESSAAPVSHQIWDELLKKHVSPNGDVNYKGFISDSIKLNQYLQRLTENPPSETNWTKNEQLAYWINAYNAFTIQLIIRNYPLKSIKDIGGKIPKVNSPWDIKFFFIGEEKMDLNTIEHNILRKKYDEPRIHFAIVCASKSCPVLLNEAFVSEKLEAQLARQTKEFLKDDFRNKITVDKVQLSKIFDWFKSDFTTKGSLIDFLNQYAPVKINADVKISYLDYDWGLNE